MLENSASERKARLVKDITDNVLEKLEIIKSINLKENSFGIEPEITIKLALKNYRFYEVGISYNGRTYEEGKKIKIKDFFIAIYCLIKYRFF